MTTLKILTYNIRTLYQSPVDGVNSFVHRAGMILDKIDREKPHIICFQEVSDSIRIFLNKYLIDYIVVGHGRLEDYSGEGLSIAYRKDSIELLALEHFWLSPTPCIPATRYEIQSEYPRICPAVLVKHKEIKTPLKIYNVHLDHISDDARILGIKQIIKKISEEKKIISFPTMIMGDFNAFPESETINFCKKNTECELIDLSENSGETFHNFGVPTDDVAFRKKIDYIFADKETAKRTYSITKWEDCFNGIYLSDHYPIFLEINF